MPNLNANNRNSNLVKLSENLAHIGIKITFVTPNHPASIVQNMVCFPEAVERYNQRTKSVFTFESTATDKLKAAEPIKRRRI